MEVPYKERYLVTVISAFLQVRPFPPPLLSWRHANKIIPIDIFDEPANKACRASLIKCLWGIMEYGEPLSSLAPDWLTLQAAPLGRTNFLLLKSGGVASSVSPQPTCELTSCAAAATPYKLAPSFGSGGVKRRGSDAAEDLA